jgi:hypothetical protein
MSRLHRLVNSHDNSIHRPGTMQAYLKREDKAKMGKIQVEVGG